MISFAVMEILEQIAIGASVVAVGRHQGKNEIDEDRLHQDELAIIRELSPRKRSEWLASRALLFQIAGLPDRAQCLYDDFGKPYLLGIDKQISVSHSGLWCAAMISEQSCGVDIQVYSDTVQRIADRFLTAGDLAQVQKSDDPFLTLHLLWGAKECVYKAYGKRKLGFREHIFISSIDTEAGHGLGEISFEGLHLYYDIYFKMLPEVAWVFCVERAPGDPHAG
jgi:4'-phosphopantetheinyl transferase